jgi:hypothetical protein
MSVHEAEALDINKDRYKKVFDFQKSHKRSFVEIEIYVYEKEYFYSLHYLFAGNNLYHGHGFAALRKWGIYESLAECKEAAIKQIYEEVKTNKEKEAVKNFDLSLFRQGELFPETEQVPRGGVHEPD